MTTFEITFWNASGKKMERTETVQARSLSEAVANANAECEDIARATGTAWVVVSICDERYNSEQAFGRLAWEGTDAEVEAAQRGE